MKQIERKRIRQLESAQLKHLTEQRAPSPHHPLRFPQSFGDTQFSDTMSTEKRKEEFRVNDSGDCLFSSFVASLDVIPSSEQTWLPEVESAEDLCETNNSFASLFADFLELPDVQGMPEWDLMNMDATPDFGIETPEETTFLSGKIKSEEINLFYSEKKLVGSQPTSSSSSRRSNTSLVNSAEIPRAIASSPQILRTETIKETIKKLSVSDTHRLVLQRSQVMEASWIVNKPNARVQNKSKKKYGIDFEFIAPKFILYLQQKVVQAPNYSVSDSGE